MRCSNSRALNLGRDPRSSVSASRSLEFSSYQAMIACVAAGTGFAIVPVSVLKALRATADVRLHALPERIRGNRTHLVWQGAPSVALARLVEKAHSEHDAAKRGILVHKIGENGEEILTAWMRSKP